MNSLSSQQTDTATMVVIRETRRSSAVGKVMVGLVGLGLVATFVSYQPNLKIDHDTAPALAVLLGFAVICMGLATILAWRNSGDFEAVEVRDNRVRLVIAPFKSPFFDAPVTETRVQRFVLPMGSWKLFLRDGTRAVELGAEMPEEERAHLAERLEKLVDAHRAS